MTEQRAAGVMPVITIATAERDLLLTVLTDW